MAISSDDQARLAEQSEFLESNTPLPNGFGARALRGSASAAFGRSLLVEALGSEEAVEDKIRNESSRRL